MSEQADQIEHNLAAIRERIHAAAQRAGRSPDAITLMAVTKGVAVARIRTAVAAGIAVCGENRVQEALPKMQQLMPLRWELIGTLQRNKVRQVVGQCARIQSVARLALAQMIARVATDQGIVVPILLQVNVAGEATKQGVAPDEVLALARAVAVLPSLRGEGLMTIAPLASDAEAARPIFARLRELRDVLRQQVGEEWQELSMGMSDDYEVAVEEGATLVRIGRALFGERPST